MVHSEAISRDAATYLGQRPPPHKTSRCPRRPVTSLLAGFFEHSLGNLFCFLLLSYYFICLFSVPTFLSSCTLESNTMNIRKTTPKQRQTPEADETDSLEMPETLNARNRNKPFLTRNRGFIPSQSRAHSLPVWQETPCSLKTPEMPFQRHPAPSEEQKKQNKTETPFMKDVERRHRTMTPDHPTVLSFFFSKVNSRFQFPFCPFIFFFFFFALIDYLFKPPHPHIPQQ